MNGNGTANAKLTRKQRRHFDRAFERIRGEVAARFTRLANEPLRCSSQHHGDVGDLRAELVGDHGLSVRVEQRLADR